MHPLVNSMLKGDKRALARLMTYTDNHHKDHIKIMKEVYQYCGKATRIGITGPPGAGKSTLVDKLIHIYRSQKKKVGVVAIDPSSPFSGGAVLGDRIRMMDHGADDKVFIRSLGSRGSHGGLSRATRDIVNLMDAFGFDVILIETVGVGQTELDIMSVAHITVVVLVPESGDTIQTMKAGLLEIANIFIVNKADREGADRIFSELKSLSEMFSKEDPVPVLKTEALNNKGITELVEAIKEHTCSLNGDRTKIENVLKDECWDIVFGEIHHRLVDQMSVQGNFSNLYKKLKRHQNPYQTATEILKKIVFK